MKLKKSISCLVVSLLLLMSVPLTANASSTLSGSGSESDPYIITTADDLAAIPTTGLGLYYKLGSNIDLSSYTQWAPIGSPSAPFTGTLDGNGYKITNLNIGTSSSPVSLSYQGLFGYTKSANIKNLGIIVAIYVNGSNIGGLVGKSDSGKITNCSVTGNVGMNTSNSVGGLVGYDFCSFAIRNCYTNCNVNGSENDGGLVGYNECGTIIDSYAIGNVVGDSGVGGFVGANLSNGLIENCYALGNVSNIFGNTLTSGVGGFAGANNSSRIINCYSTGKVSNYHTSGTIGYLGAFVGYNISYSTINDSYWCSSNNTKYAGYGYNNKSTCKIIGMTLASMETQSFASTLNTNIGTLGWQAEDSWLYSSSINNGLPYLDGVIHDL